MKTTSDKKVSIYNLVNIIHDYENDDMQKLSIDLTNYFINKKIFWIFKDNLIPNKNFMNFCLSFAREDNYINIIILKKDGESNKLKVLKAVMKTFGKKIIIVTNKNKKNKDDESVFFCKVSKNKTDLKKKIIHAIKKI